jgi:hypothetical protein
MGANSTKLKSKKKSQPDSEVKTLLLSNNSDTPWWTIREDLYNERYNPPMKWGNYCALWNDPENWSFIFVGILRSEILDNTLSFFINTDQLGTDEAPISQVVTTFFLGSHISNELLRYFLMKEFLNDYVLHQDLVKLIFDIYFSPHTASKDAIREEQTIFHFERKVIRFHYFLIRQGMDLYGSILAYGPLENAMLYCISLAEIMNDLSNQKYTTHMWYDLNFFKTNLLYFYFLRMIIKYTYSFSNLLTLAEMPMKTIGSVNVIFTDYFEFRKLCEGEGGICKKDKLQKRINEFYGCLYLNGEKPRYAPPKSHLSLDPIDLAGMKMMRKEIEEGD